MKSIKMILGLICMMMVAFALLAIAGDLTDITLSTPCTNGGKPLMEALKERQSVRSFSTKKLPLQVLSDLLWAAFGINRSDSGKRTAPSARNWQEVDIYVTLEDGVYLYDAQANTLRAIAKGDLRKLTGTQSFVASAPLNLVYVADITRMKGVSPEDQALYSGADVGFISQNVYLFCASAGLSTVVRGSIDRDALGKTLNFPEQKKIILAQTVGYPVNKGQ